MLKNVLPALLEQGQLSQSAAREAMLDLASNRYNPSEMAAFMATFRLRGITVAELSGFREAMLELCIPVRLPVPVLDVCGTGGDGKDTFNISTLTAMVVAAAGPAVAKHGNYSVSSACGSSDVLEYFGYRFPGDSDRLSRSLEQANICFLHAPFFHPLMKNVAPVRKALAVKTFFNMLGPLVNPCLPHLQLAGVYSLELARQYAYLYQQTGQRFMVIHSLDGYDEVSLTGAFKCFDNRGENIYHPEDLGLLTVSPTELSGGSSVEAAARIFLDILRGHGSPAQKAVVTANAGMALYALAPEKGITAAIEQAREALESGKAFKTFQKLLNS